MSFRKCVICQKEEAIRGPSHKVIDGVVVCIDCWTDGYGRLPDLPLPGQEEEERELYVSDKDKGLGGVCES